MRRWFLGADGERPPWHELERALGDAIEWIVTAARRLIERRAHRIDRAAEYRSLALLLDRAPTTADCHALFAAVFGLYQPRHFSVPDPDPEATPSTLSWWHAPPAPVEASLYRPGARPAGAGRVSQLPDHSMARHSLAARRARERDELRRAQQRFARAGRLRLEQLGYRLAVRGDHARLYKRPHTDYHDRPARIRPGAAKPGPEDGWAPFTRRHYVLLALALAALERHHGRAQMLIGGLATDVASLGAELQLRVDFERREERKAFADALELLCRLGVLRQRDGSRDAFVARDGTDEEALFDIEHGCLGSLKATPVALTDVESARELVAEEYPLTEDGERARRRHRVARALVEDSLLYTSDLEPGELDTYRSQRHRLEPELEALTGLTAERRHEGSALVDPSRTLTDRRFPTRSTESTLALLACERLRALAHDGDRNPLPRSEIAAALAEVAGRVGADAGPELLDAVLELLEAHRLIVQEPPALVRVLPGLARFARPTMRSAR